MIISEVIAALTLAEAEHGDIEVMYLTPGGAEEPVDFVYKRNSEEGYPIILLK